MRTMSSMHFSVCSPALRLHVCVIQPFVTRDYVWARPPARPSLPFPLALSVSLSDGRWATTRCCGARSRAAARSLGRTRVQARAHKRASGARLQDGWRGNIGPGRWENIKNPVSSSANDCRFPARRCQQSSPPSPLPLAHSNSRCPWSGGPSGHILSRSHPRGWGVGHGAATTAPACSTTDLARRPRASKSSRLRVSHCLWSLWAERHSRQRSVSHNATLGRTAAAWQAKESTGHLWPLARRTVAAPPVAARTQWPHSAQWPLGHCATVRRAH